MKGLLPYLILFPAWLLWGPASAQEGEQAPFATGAEEVSRRDFDEATWRELTEGINYSADRIPKKKEEVTKRDGADGARGHNGGSFSAGTGQLLMKGLIIVLGIIVLIVLIRSLMNFRRRPRDKKFDPKDLNIDIDQIEENIHESDLQSYIRRSVEQGNFTLAVRLYFLAILKELSLRKFIRWKKDKTNREYRRELSGHPLAGDFDRLTGIFEQVWYGNQPLDREQFGQVERHFKEFLEKTQAGPAPANGAPTLNNAS